MNASNSWQTIRDEVKRRVHEREWTPGASIPNESDLAREFGCARTTVNRALRALADDGLLERRRKAGTRVALHPVPKATFDIPIIRHEIEALGQRAGYGLLSARTGTPDVGVLSSMNCEPRDMLHLVSLHLADDRPFMMEDRWIDTTIVPAAANVDFSKISANEWLVLNASYTEGHIEFSAEAIGDERALHFGCSPHGAGFTITRTTRVDGKGITHVVQAFVPGYSMSTRL
ncbi:MAG: GntR family transcriptional regulator [Pseudomonadota bacterium]